MYINRKPMSGLEPLTSSLPRRCSNLLSYMGMSAYDLKPGAGDGTRTRNNQLGRLILYQLSYSRTAGGERWIRTTVGVRRQIYSLIPLTTRASPHAGKPTTRFERVTG